MTPAGTDAGKRQRPGRGLRDGCAVVIPCLNEGATIAGVVRAAGRWGGTVVVVDDGSSDGTAELARGAGAKVLRHEQNRGKGRALHSGLAWALRHGFARAITMDGDGQHAPEDLPALWRCAERTRAPLIIGNRMAEAAKMRWLRRQVNRWMSGQLSRQAGRELPDTQSGFRLIDLRMWSALRLEAERFEVESEMLMAFLGAGAPVEFVPVRVRAGARASHIRPGADAWRWLKWWWRLSSSRRAIS